ncbi:UDP-N-acetylmuramoylalanine--D-glutamate ligase [Rhodococcoides trifolii]|uniref:UDP-N-acetylmuramoylalanine--D-glutamate ligase n=1 Tax=Rhodococcoides trifolii TaxID=908250 RepID=A0A917FVV3_9NOCA|nr:UDP-N-acetylmuramoyl-L-alanine--D-glutamate ligase [Rhodococcus trifolii]GGG05482.1 UDP-N-acetylmuramoylalanine--D-glutamate ligase [Rhodococcus trifolii]
MVLESLAGKRVLVTGGRVTGRAVVPVLLDLGARVTVADSDSGELERCAALGAETVVISELDAAAVSEFALVVTSPGFRPDASPLDAAAAAGVPIWGDVELAWRVDRAGVYGPPRTWAVVTGTNGKTTTTSMLELILRADGRRAVACGNIGVPVADALRNVEQADVLAIELSSFQLFWAPSVRPDAGVVVNIAEDHLDWHGSMDAYVEAKLRAVSGRIGVVGLDDPIAGTLLPRASAEKTFGFTAETSGPGRIGVEAGHLVDRVFADGELLADVADIEPSGPAGLQDALAAASVARAVGVSAGAVADGLRGFRVGPHRAAVVRELGGVVFVDDSKATNPHAARSSILAHDRVVWLAGGLLKGAVVDDLVRDVASRLIAAVVFGRDADQIAGALARHAPDVPVVRVLSGDDADVVDDTDVTDGDEVMRRVVREAASRALPGSAVLLAPSTASFDQFRDYGHRGDSFAAAALALTAGDLAGHTR